MRVRIALCVLVLAMTAVSWGPGEGQAADCEQYLKSINKLLPLEVGDQKALTALLDVKPTNWAGRVDPSAVLLSLGEEGTPTIRTLSKTYSGIGVARSAQGKSQLRFNLLRGELKYVNPDRAFSPEFPNAYDPEKAKTLVFDLLGQLGLPEGELSFDRLDSNVLGGRAALPGSTKWEQDYAIETHFFVPRTINGVSVMNSTFTVGVSNQGRISMFRARWPALQIDQALLRAKILSRSDVARAVHDKLVEEQGCVGLTASSHFNMFLAYVPADADVPDKDNIPEAARGVLYTPKLIVVFMPTTGRAGKTGGSQLEFDLFAR